MSLIGELTDERPGFRFVLEQNQIFDEKDFSMILELYKIATRAAPVN